MSELSCELKCGKHPTYQALRKPTSMCAECWMMWDAEVIARNAKDTADREVSTMTEPEDLEGSELRQLALDIADNKVFTDRHCRTPGEVGMCFPVLQFMKLCDRKFLAAHPPALVYEYYSKAAPMGVNGLPMFFSCRMLNVHDMELVHEMVNIELQRRAEFVNKTE